MVRETELLQAALAGDTSAFERIVQKYQATICAITFSQTGRLDVSEELAQETFVNAWTHLHQLRDLHGFRPWLYSIARNAIRNYHRRKKPTSLEARPVEVVAEDLQDPSGILIGKEDLAMLEQAILRLPPPYREPLVMFYRQQRSVRETAEALGLSEATVRLRLHRARNRLREDVAERLERTLSRTGPHREFTKAVMAAIAGVAAGLSSTAEAAAPVISDHPVTGGISAMFANTAIKVATIAAVVVAAGALISIHANRDTSLQPDAREAMPVVEPSRAAPLAYPQDTEPEPVGVDPLRQAGNGDASREEADGTGRQTERTAAGDSVDQAAEEAPPTIVTGTVLDRNTRIPITGARVQFKRSKVALTDVTGRFRLSLKEVGGQEDILIVRAPSYATETIAMTVNEDERQDVVITMGPGMTLAGKVVDPNHDPIGNVEVRASFDMWITPVGKTDAQGRFRLEGLHPDAPYVYLRAGHPDYSDAEISQVPLERAFLGEEVYREVVLAPSPAWAVVSGRVTNARSEPVAGATVAQHRTWKETRTDQDGRYALKGLEGDSIVLCVSHPEYPVLFEDLTLPSGGQGTQVDVRLADPQGLSGRVLDDLGRAVADATIGIKSHRGRDVWGLGGLFRSDSEGLFTIPNAPSQGEYSLLVLGSAIHRATHTVDQGQDECVVVVSRSGRIYGRAVDAETGRPLTCFRVAVNTYNIPSTWAQGILITSQHGDFDTGRLELTEGEHLPLTVSADGYDPVRLEGIPVQPISERPDRTLFALQRDERRSTLHVGRVLDIEGQPIQGAEVGFRENDLKQGTRGFSRVVTDRSGVYTISSIDPDEQIFYVRARGYAPYYGPMSALLLETPGVLVDVVLEQPAAISGTAWDEFGQPIADATIRCSPAVQSKEEADLAGLLSDVLWPETKTDEFGHYQLGELPVGNTHIFVLCEDGPSIAPRTVAVRPGESVDLDFGERAGFVISGLVTELEKPLECVDVQLQPTDRGRKSHWGKTDVAGMFRIIHVPPGEYVFATIRSRSAGQAESADPNDRSHILYEVVEIRGDLDFTVDYTSRTIGQK